MKRSVIANEAFRHLLMVSADLQAAFNRLMPELTLSQLLVLETVSNAGGRMGSLNDLAFQFGTTRQNIRKLVGGLEAKACLRSTPSKTDRRALEILLTDTGRDYLVQYAPALKAATRQIFKNLSKNGLENLRAEVAAIRQELERGLAEVPGSLS